MTSADGTRIAYERLGSGPAIILVGGLLSDRKGGAPLARALADDFTVYMFDRGAGAKAATLRLTLSPKRSRIFPP